MITLDSVIQAHGSALLSYVTQLTGDRYVAEDIVQETWIKAWRHLDRLTEDYGSVRAWLKRVARNAVIDQYRRRRARPAEVTLLEHQQLGSTAVYASPSDEVETRMEVDAALNHLSTAHRHALAEVYLADRTTDSAASVLGVPAGTVKSRVHYALRTLRETLPAQAA